MRILSGYYIFTLLIILQWLEVIRMLLFLY